jgi:hypothetical protein
MHSTKLEALKNYSEAKRSAQSAREAVALSLGGPGHAALVAEYVAAQTQVAVAQAAL